MTIDLRLPGRILLALVAVPVMAGADDGATTRAELERMEWALDRAVGKVSRPSGAPLLGGAAACRGYHIHGYGALFVLAPRALPLRARSAHESPPEAGADTTPPVLRARLERLEAQRRRVQDRGRESERDELLALEAQVAALQHAAATAREEAELALEETTRELHRRLLSSTLGATPAAAAPASPAPAVSDAAVTVPPPPVPPWRFWFEGEEPEEPRSPEGVILDVRSAVTEVLEAQGASLPLLPEEFVAVVVDFLPRSAFAARTRPSRTLLVRVRKKELEERAAGRLPPEELRRRIEVSEY